MIVLEDKRTINEIINQAKLIEENNWKNMEYTTGIDLLLTSDNNGTVKDKNIAKDFSQLKEKIEDMNDLTEKLLSKLENQ